ncbi:MAG: RseA family anti-sigma factor [Gammaproteobacteria bacterium]|nr:RseA family anti-sigma factor [Gammaproteobacteria bacterium]
MADPRKDAITNNEDRDEERAWLSALADGELHGAELERQLGLLRDDPRLLASWQAYHLIRDTVSSNLNHAVAPQLHLRVAAALESEPTILAPRQRRPWLKQVAGLAIAASVTGVAIIGLQNMNGIDATPAAAQVAEKQEYLRIEPSLVAQQKAQAGQNQNNDALDRYLVNHNEYAVSSGIQGVLPYVRIVGYKAGQ